MVLPPALLAKLQKRGIIKTSQKEEVYAEAYDDKQQKSDDENEENSKDRGGAIGCPNKWNQYHVCTDFCHDHWGDGTPEFKLGQTYQTERRAMLIKYPLPENWKEIYDPGMCRHYYWNPLTDEVCWLSPRHPNAVVGMSAQALATEFFESKKSHNVDARDDDFGHRGKRSRNDRRREDEERRDRRRERDSEKDDPIKDLVRQRRRDESSLALAIPQEDDKSMELSDRDRLKRARIRGLDPMDPAAYGDAPEGKWAAGIASEAKTGVDVTATGPLFQSRPYPAPGAVLRRNNPDKKE